MSARRDAHGRPFADPRVAAIFSAFPDGVRARLLELRELIFSVAAATEGVGAVDETVRWGQASYVTPNGAGSTIRLDAAKAGDEAELLFICHTDLVATSRELYPASFRYGGERLVAVSADAPFDEAALRHCVGLALTYHLRKRAGAGAP